MLSSGTGDQRIAILVTGLFFVIGIVTLRLVDEKAGIAAAKAYNNQSSQ